MYTQGATPVIVLGTPQDRLHVTCYIDEILLSRLPAPEKMKAQMTIRGTDAHIPLQFERIQPFVSPKIELSNQRQERVDVRVLPVIFSFIKPLNTNIYPGELVDVEWKRKSVSSDGCKLLHKCDCIRSRSYVFNMSSSVLNGMMRAYRIVKSQSILFVPRG